MTNARDLCDLSLTFDKNELIDDLTFRQSEHLTHESRCRERKQAANNEMGCEAATDFAAITLSQCKRETAIKKNLITRFVTLVIHSNIVLRNCIKKSI